MLSAQELQSSTRKELLEELQNARQELLKTRIGVKGKSIKDALNIIEDETPEKYDAKIVHAFASIVENALQITHEDDEKNSRPPPGVQLSSDDIDEPKHPWSWR